MVKQKGLKITIWILVSILLASGVFIISFSVYNKRKENKEPSATYTFNSSLIDDSTYNSYSEFHINSYEGFKSFVISCRDAYASNMGMQYRANYTYAGKTVKLLNSISIPSDANPTVEYDLILYSFSGTFDGQGYSLYYSYTESYCDSTMSAFCRTLESGGVIKNTRFYDVGLVVTSGTGQSVVGLIVGENKGTVESCIVQNCKFISDRYRSNCSVASIAGANNGTIKNCMVRGTYEIGGKAGNFMSNPDGLNAYYFAVSGTYPTNSIFVANVLKVTNDDNDGSYVSTPSECDSLGSSNYSSCATAYSGMSSSVASKTAGEDGTPWYKYSVNTRGFDRSASLCVYLRCFISWTTYIFNISPSGAGVLNYSSLTVPTDYNNVTEVTNNQLLIDLNYITPTPATGNEFDKWTNSGNTYTANFIVRIQLSFTTATNTTIDSSSTVVLGTTYYLANPTTITFTHEDYTKSNCFKSYTISFIDKEGDSYFIKYKANTNYYISGNTMSTSNASYSMTSNKTNITVNTSLKTYNLTIK